MTQQWPDMAATYDAVAEDYATAFADELAGKPFDRKLLDEFAAAVRGRGGVLDVGCSSARHMMHYCHRPQPRQPPGIGNVTKH